MKKILLVVCTALMLACCTFQNESRLIKSYVEDIKKQLSIDADTEYCYTYQKVEPQENHAHIVDFYTFTRTDSYSQWICIKVGNEIDCDMLFIKHL